MDNALIIAIFAGIGGMLGWGCAEVATKKSVDKIGTVSSLVWVHLLGTLILATMFFLRPIFVGEMFLPSLNIYEWLGVAFFGTLQTIVYYFVFKGFEKGQVSLLSPIFASFTGFVALFSVLIFGEVLNMGLGLSLLVIFSGIMIINLDFQDLKSGKIQIHTVAGLKEILIGTACATFWTLGWYKFITNKDWLIYTALLFVFMTISAYLIALFNKVNLLEAKSDVWKYLCIVAIGETFAYVAITYGYANTNYVSVIALLSGALSVPTMILARIFLGEKMSKTQVFGAVIVILGIAILSLT